MVKPVRWTEYLSLQETFESQWIFGDRILKLSSMPVLSEEVSDKAFAGAGSRKWQCLVESLG